MSTDSNMKRTKVICTLGPATDADGVLKSMIESGMDVARFNFSHGLHDEHEHRLTCLKEARDEACVPVATILDTKGPSIRIGKIKKGQASLSKGANLTLVEEQIEGDDKKIHQNCKGLCEYVVPGTVILIDDGLIELSVEEVKGTDICCIVQNSGILHEGKQVNLPGTEVPLPFITDKDRADLLFGIKHEMDFVAASFVSCADDVRIMRDFLIENGGSSIRIIAKIENASAVKNIDEILDASDAIMIARGDLGVEVPFTEVPHIQKQIIKKCNEAYKPAIIATQMLESMIVNARPTRAEVTDVANAIYEGADTIMLSGETAVGSHPVAAVQTMTQIAQETEPHIYQDGSIPNRANNTCAVSAVIGKAATSAAETLGAKCIIVPTITGRSARLISNFRPNVPICAVTTTEKTCRSLQLNWGVTPIIGNVVGESSFILEQACNECERHGFVQKDDICVLTLGDRHTSPSTTKRFLASLDPNAPEPCPTNVVEIIQIGVERNFS
jgi:pyruvate kinase